MREESYHIGRLRDSERVEVLDDGDLLRVELESLMLKLLNLGPLPVIEKLMPAMHKDLARIYRDAHAVRWGFKKPEKTE